ncbi:MAG TPA: hypothetical protein VN030_00330 [Cellvibrio sp.]|nr:hypothetical protein [Cellvibrio sp.]
MRRDSGAMEDSNMQAEREHIRHFISRVGGAGPSFDADITHIREAFLSVLNIFDRLNFYAIEEFAHNTPERSLQYDLRGTLHYRVAQLLNSDSPSAVPLLDTILDGIPAVLLTGYQLEWVVPAHSGYFLPRLETEWRAILQNKIQNRERMGLNRYINYHDGKQLLHLCPDVAQRVLPLVFQYDWDAGFRMDFADALYDVGNRSEDVERYRDLRYNHFSDPYFRSLQCFDHVQEVIEYHVERRGTTALSAEAERLEELLKNLALKYPGSQFDHYFTNKWHGENWHKRTMTLARGWRFHFERAPYIERARLYVDGGEYERNQYVACFPEQVEWLHKTLAEHPFGKYSCSWVIDFTLWGNSLLKHVLGEIEKLGDLVEDAVTSPV